MKAFCEKCNSRKETAIKRINEEYYVKDVQIIIEADVRYCAECGENLWDNELDDMNLKKAYESYKKMIGLLSSEEIKSIRAKYGLSQNSFAKLLGFGGKTITRYENGAIQEKAQDNLIRLMNDIEVFEKLLTFNSKEFSHKEKMQFEDKLIKLKKADKGVVILYPTVNNYKLKTNIL